MGNRGDRRALHRVAWGASVLLIAWWTLLPFAHDLSASALRRAFLDIQWIPFIERGRAPLWSDVLANLALFVPYGASAWRCLERRRRRLWWVVCAAAVTSFAVETLQLGLPARRTSATDLVIDVLGAALGASLAKAWEVQGRQRAHGWWRRYTGGGREHGLVLLFAVCLLLWAVLPGGAPDAGVWQQTQGLSSSFRRFPGWHEWLQRSLHPFLLGALFAILAARSSQGGLFVRGVFGFGSSALLGLALELAQLLVPQRRPAIFDALAFGAGGLLSFLLAALPPLALRVAALFLMVGGVLAPAYGDYPPLVTVVMVLVGGMFLFSATPARPARAGTTPTACGGRPPQR